MKGDIIHGSETLDTLVMIKVYILITQDAQDGPLRHVMLLNKGLRTDSEISFNFPNNRVLSHRCTCSAERSQVGFRVLQCPVSRRNYEKKLEQIV